VQFTSLKYEGWYSVVSRTATKKMIATYYATKNLLRSPHRSGYCVACFISFRASRHVTWHGNAGNRGGSPIPLNPFE